jgi:hypothetical protein
MKTRTDLWNATGGPARSLFVVASVLALLALALLPIGARAEKSSSEITYFDGPPELESVPSQNAAEPHGPTAKQHHGDANPDQHGSPSRATAEGGTKTVNEPEGEPHSEGHHHAGAVPPVKGNNPPPGGGQTGKNASPGPAGGSARKSVRNVTPGPREPTASKADTAGAGGGGSSPLLPVLIAMAVLAATSIGVVLYRQRREDSGPDGYAG